MELNDKLTALEDEVKVLKSEVKTILKEIRTTLLASDNPFAPDPGGAVFRPVERPPSPSTLEEEPESEGAEPMGQEEAPPLPSATMPEPIATQQAVAPEPRVTETAPASAGAPPNEEWAPRWSLMTIASLAAWAEEATGALGAQRLHIILDLAEFAGLVPEEVQEALLKLTKLGKSKGADGDSGTSINESLVVLRQLEAILHGEDPDEFSVRRSARRYGRIR
jgi:hypothetical protein